MCLHLFFSGGEVGVWWCHFDFNIYKGAAFGGPK